MGAPCGMSTVKEGLGMKVWEKIKVSSNSLVGLIKVEYLLRTAKQK